jgi:hypothetical protein
MKREEEAFKVLTNNIPNLLEAIDFAISLDVSRLDDLWDLMLSQGQLSTSKLNNLLQYIDL